jgi:O-antigen/teichoic acid export membrane protein
MSLSSISSILYENTANILINIFYGPVFNAIYAVSLKIPMTINNIFLRSTWSLAPTITDLVAKNDNDRLQRLFFTYSKILCIVTLPVILFIMAMSRKIIDLWVGNSFLQASGLLSIHLIPLIIILPLTVVNLVPNAYAKVKIPSQVTLFVAVINVALGVTLAKYFGLKLYGFAISAAICTFINSGVFLPYYSCKISGLSIYRYILNAFLRPFLLGCLLIVPLFLIIRSFHFNSSLGMVFIQGVLAVLIYYSLSYLYLINKYEKGLIAGIINRRIL